MKATMLVALLCAVGAEGKGYGTRAYQTPSKTNTKAWKYAAAAGAGVAAGGLLYYVGSRSYNVHTRYRNKYRKYWDEQDNEWKQRNPLRSNVDCTPEGGLREDETDAWVVVQIAMNKTRGDFVPTELEVDLFNELLFRSPCSTPTQVVSLYECFLSNSSITAADKLSPSKCRVVGDVESLPEEHVAAQRKLMGVSDRIVYEMAVGAEDVAEAKVLLAALSEAVRDDQGLFSKYYATDSDMHGAEIIALSAESAQSTASPPATSAPWTYAPFTYAPWTNAPAGETNTPHVSYAPRPSYLPWTYTPRTSVPYASFSHYEEDDEDDGSPASGLTPMLFTVLLAVVAVLM